MFVPRAVLGWKLAVEQIRLEREREMQGKALVDKERELQTKAARALALEEVRVMCKARFSF